MASARPIGCHQASPGPSATATPASALAAIATPILSFKSEIAIPVVARMVVFPVTRDRSPEQPEFRQIFPVDEVVEREADKEDRDQNDRARQLDGAFAAVIRRHRAAA